MKHLFTLEVAGMIDQTSLFGSDTKYIDAKEYATSPSNRGAWGLDILVEPPALINCSPYTGMLLEK